MNYKSIVNLVLSVVVVLALLLSLLAFISNGYNSSATNGPDLISRNVAIGALAISMICILSLAAMKFYTSPKGSRTLVSNTTQRKKTLLLISAFILVWLAILVNSSYKDSHPKYFCNGQEFRTLQEQYDCQENATLKNNEDSAYSKFKSDYTKCAGDTSDAIIREKWNNGGYSNILCN